MFLKPQYQRTSVSFVIKKVIKTGNFIRIIHYLYVYSFYIYLFASAFWICGFKNFCGYQEQKQLFLELMIYLRKMNLRLEFRCYQYL